MTSPPSLFVPRELQLHANPEVWQLSGFYRSFFNNLIRGLGRRGVVGPQTAIALIGWEWPQFLPLESPEWRWLYVARCPALNLVKIGLSADPLERMQTLRSERHTKETFELVGALPCCSMKHESRLCELMSDSRENGREWFHDTVATRMLCWAFVAQRSNMNIADELSRAPSPLADMVQGLRFVCTGAIPRYGFNKSRCSVCSSRRHTRRACPEAPPLPPRKRPSCRFCGAHEHFGNRCPVERERRMVAKATQSEAQAN